MVDFAQSLGLSTPPEGAVATRPRPAVSPPRSRAATLWFAGVGAVAYNSWPLAFLVNRTLAGSALASSFESRSEPFAWLFILLDCVAGLCIGIVCVRELRSRWSPWSLWTGGALGIVLLAYGVFGAATAVDAVVPLDCGSVSAQACAGQLWPITPDDVLTGTAVFALFVATLTILARTAVARRARSREATIMTLILVGWCASGFVVLAADASGALAALCQYAFLTLTSILSFLVALHATRLTDA